jgi:hypothetical protein
VPSAWVHPDAARRPLGCDDGKVGSVTRRTFKLPSPLTSCWPTMKSIALTLAPAALIAIFASHSSAQTQTAPKADSATTASTPKVQAPAATPSDRTAATPNTSVSKSTRQSTLSRKSRRIPPPPPLTPRHTRSEKKGHLGAATDNATDLDAYGRVDSSGKQVPFYPGTRGTNSVGKHQTSAYRKGARAKASH